MGLSPTDSFVPNTVDTGYSGLSRQCKAIKKSKNVMNNAKTLVVSYNRTKFIV